MADMGPERIDKGSRRGLNRQTGLSSSEIITEILKGPLSFKPLDLSPFLLRTLARDDRAPRVCRECSRRVSDGVETLDEAISPSLVEYQDGIGMELLTHHSIARPILVCTRH